MPTYTPQQIASQKALKEKIAGSAGNTTRPAVAPVVTPGLKVNYTPTPAGQPFSPQRQQDQELAAYNASQIKPPLTSPTPPPAAPQNNQFGGLSQEYIKSNPNQAAADLASKGYSMSDAYKLVNQARGINTNLTLDSGDFTSANTLQRTNVPSLQESLNQVNSMFTPMTADQRNEIAAQVDAEYKQKIAEQEMMNKSREAQFQASLAQRGDVGFGQSDLGAGGKVLTADYGQQKMQELQRIIAQEKANRIAAAEGEQRKQQESALNMAQKLRQDQINENQTLFKNQLDLAQNDRANAQLNLQQGQSVLKNITDLDANSFAQLDPQELANTEAQLGLPTGYMDALYMNKQNAETAKNAEDFNKFAQQQITMASQLPEGQTFQMANPITGDLIEFIGNKDYTQVVSNKYGIFSVDKKTNKVTQIQSFSGMPGYGGGGAKPAKMTDQFKAWYYKTFNESTDANPASAQAEWERFQSTGMGTRLKEEPPAPITDNDIWASLGNPDTQAKSDKEKSTMIQDLGFDPRKFGFDLPSEY